MWFAKVGSVGRQKYRPKTNVGHNIQSAGLSRADTVFIVCERICKLKHSVCEKENPTNSKPEVVSSNPLGVRDFFSLSVWAHFLSRANAPQKVLFGIFIRAL